MPPPVDFPNSVAIDNALHARLDTDAELRALLPDGVWFDLAPKGSTRYVLLSLDDGQDTLGQGSDRRAVETRLYRVEAVAMVKVTTPGGAPELDAAVTQIDWLLQGHLLAVANFQPMACYRLRPIRWGRPDEADPLIQWLGRGGMYHVEMSVGSH